MHEERRHRHQARGESPRGRSAGRPDCRGGRPSSCADPAARLATPSARLARTGGLGRRRARATLQPASRGPVHPRPHRRGRDWQHTLPAVAELPNVYVDLSGSGVDRGMLDCTVTAVGASRMVWGSDLTMETGLAKLWALDVIGLSREDIAAIRWRNAARIFPSGSFPSIATDESIARRAPAGAS